MNSLSLYPALSLILTDRDGATESVVGGELVVSLSLPSWNKMCFRQVVCRPFYVMNGHLYQQHSSRGYTFLLHWNDFRTKKSHSLESSIAISRWRLKVPWLAAGSWQPAAGSVRISPLQIDLVVIESVTSENPTQSFVIHNIVWRRTQICLW